MSDVGFSIEYGCAVVSCCILGNLSLESCLLVVLEL